MQGLGATQVGQIKHKYIGITGALAQTFGTIPFVFQSLLYGGNGNGKTEFAFQVVKELQKHGRVDWISYEQGHGPDIQASIKRHNVQGDKWDCVFYDPHKTRNYNISMFDELMHHLKKSQKTKFVVIDSVDACGFSNDQYHELFSMYGRKKGFIWLSFEGSNKKPKTSLARNIGGEGSYIIRVKDFIATVEKSRFGGFHDYIIWDEKARERNPLYFADKESQTKPQTPKGASSKTSKKGKIIAI